MSTKDDKRPCAIAGCRAWAKRGESLCASHLRSNTIRRHSREVLPLLRATSQTPLPPPGQAAGEGGVEVIDRELEQLLEARRFFRCWVEQQRRREESGEAQDGPRPLSPAQFMQAWNSSTTRVIELVKARRELLGSGANAADALIQEVLDEVAQGLPGDLPDDASRADADVAPGGAIEPREEGHHGDI
jgi:hypothetical protein